MFLLSLAALAVYWKYIRENIPLDFHYPSNSEVLRHSPTDFDSPEANTSEDGNNNNNLPYKVPQPCNCLHTNCNRSSERLCNYTERSTVCCEIVEHI